ncbi:hypothetical protein GGR56DRAFT_67409 [Xylariaceae sp. FL0804]|nr:hypothetical protein GGR56DRAFT_67409 [Xylariaceae sp. FL0804]
MDQSIKSNRFRPIFLAFPSNYWQRRLWRNELQSCIIGKHHTVLMQTNKQTNSFPMIHTYHLRSTYILSIFVSLLSSLYNSAPSCGRKGKGGRGALTARWLRRYPRQTERQTETAIAFFLSSLLRGGARCCATMMMIPFLCFVFFSLSRISGQSRAAYKKRPSQACRQTDGRICVRRG